MSPPFYFLGFWEVAMNAHYEIRLSEFKNILDQMDEESFGNLDSQVEFAIFLSKVRIQVDNYLESLKKDFRGQANKTGVTVLGTDQKVTVTVPPPMLKLKKSADPKTILQNGLGDFFKIRLSPLPEFQDLYEKSDQITQKSLTNLVELVDMTPRVSFKKALSE